MADILTQLQDCLDQLATQFYASIRYISTHHDFSPVGEQEKLSSTDVTPDPPQTFLAAQRELARDLIVKEQQIEYLISVLPGIGTSEKEQEERLKALERELREAEEERQAAVQEKEKLLERLDEVIRSIRRV
ncbi:CSE2-domain-containing protein [Xylona heveae TC161]|uniref:Mediator of RNA polymerase II transcription subunit 21 n=1 Tax=Xylona heveae (strain CBS 132557 / TC161) TaxID=1328760 RepID=A0A165HF99_XYLHT|nr:CSE2-domain-containing protein [Xylona heveae TC161]KZF23423.1 CSE2-domain-containing protein [Xylona heveae TC161]